MIVLAGIPTEPALARVADALDRLGVPVLWLNQRDVTHNALSTSLDQGGLRGELVTAERSCRVEDIAAVYTRLIDDRRLPELAGCPPDSPLRAASREFHDTFHQWLEVSTARVVNRPSAMGSNGSKPYQAQLIVTAGFAVPETLVTNDPDAVRRFRARHGRVIYKSASGMRSIVHELEPADLERLHDIEWCPVQFQARVPGYDLRVHVIGRRCFATRVHSTAIDYRYAAASGTPARLEAVDLDDLDGARMRSGDGIETLAQRCVALTEALGLRFAGIDLRIRDDGPPVCFEVNPSPAYAYYEVHTGQPIASTVARHLAGLAT